MTAVEGTASEWLEARLAAWLFMLDAPLAPASETLVLSSLEQAQAEALSVGPRRQAGTGGGRPVPVLIQRCLGPNSVGGESARLHRVRPARCLAVRLPAGSELVRGRSDLLDVVGLSASLGRRRARVNMTSSLRASVSAVALVRERIGVSMKVRRHGDDEHGRAGRPG
jgi:hypothetical protein